MPFSKDRLRDALDGITVRGSFAGSCKFERTVDPQIFVEDVGTIKLPLSDEQAQQIISKARLAPCGKGSETIVDTTIRNTWELDSHNFKITAGAQWDEWLNSVLQHVANTLGITDPIHAELYKMLLYEKGAMFKAHTDTEKIPHMFGTLVISLPSPYTGGNVVVKHLDKRRVLNTFEHELAASFWYSDVSHEVLPVKSGYRWVLTYNLATTPSPERPLGDVMETGNKPLHEVMMSWARGSEAMPLYYALEHKYTQANISLAGLKARDRACVEELEKVSRDLGFEIFLATLEREDRGTAEDNDYDHYGRYHDYYDEEEDEDDDNEGGHHAIEECIDSELAAKFIYDLRGNEVMSSITIDESNILQEDPFGEDPDEEDYEGYMGNYVANQNLIRSGTTLILVQGPETTHWYRLSWSLCLRKE
ncbi:hypothetical protein HD806DRAFT_287663 [Xylariaceae sp. AK1471]|nr:hypothetical protein HD806DRAFT_287663 [Xylariaceae sp. AK1471]